MIELCPLEDYTALDTAIANLESYDWVIFTSANAVDFFLRRLRIAEKDWRSVRGRICAIGPATASALEPIVRNSSRLNSTAKGSWQHSASSRCVARVCCCLELRRHGKSSRRLSRTWELAWMWWTPMPT